MGNCVGRRRTVVSKSRIIAGEHDILDGVRIIDKTDQGNGTFLETRNSKIENASLGKDFSFCGESFRAKVVEVYDGDTIRIVFDVAGFGRVQWRARMVGYDSPEMKPPLSDPGREEIKKKAVAARVALVGRVLNKVVRCDCGEFDKYGRVLVMLYTHDVPGTSVNDWMIAQGHGYAYDGGKKPNSA